MFSGDFDLSVYKGIRIKDITVSKKPTPQEPSRGGRFRDFSQKFINDTGYREITVSNLE